MDSQRGVIVYGLLFLAALVNIAVSALLHPGGVDMNWLSNLFLQMGLWALAIIIIFWGFYQLFAKDLRVSRMQSERHQLLQRAREGDRQALEQLQRYRMLAGQDFSQAQLNAVVLDKVKLARTRFEAASLQGASFEEADLQGAVFKESDLTQARFREATLVQTDFSMAIMRGTNFNRAYMQDALLRGANLESASLRWAELISANLESAYLSDADLTEANLGAANLHYAQLINARMMKCSLLNAELTEANLQGANLINADLRGAILLHANLVQANLTRAQFDESTILPNGRRWTHNTDMTEYTDQLPPRQNFWRNFNHPHES